MTNPASPASPFDFGALHQAPAASTAAPLPAPAPGLTAVAGPFVALLDEQVAIRQDPSLLDYAYPEPTTVMLHVVELRVGQFGTDYRCLVIPVSRAITGSFDRGTGALVPWRVTEHVQPGEQRNVFVGGVNKLTAQGIEERQLTAGVRWTCVRVEQSGKPKPGARLQAPTAQQVADASAIAAGFEAAVWRV